MQRAAAGLLLLALAAAGAAAVAGQRVETDLVSLFTFSEGQSDVSAIYTSDVQPLELFGNLAFRPGSAAWEDQSIGLQFLGGQSFVAGASERNSTEFRELVSTSAGFTVEMWISVPEVVEQPEVIMAFSNYPDASVGVAPFQRCAENPAEAPSVAISVTDTRNVLFEFMTDFLECTTVSLRLANGTDPQLVALTYDIDSEIYRAFVNIDTPRFGRVDEFNTTFWLPNPVQLSPPLQGESGDVRSFEGTVYMMAMYNRSLTPAEVAQNYAAGLPNSAPVVRAAEFNISEDTPTVVQLEATDFDGDALTMEVLLPPLDGRGNLSAVYANGTELPVLNTTVPVPLDPASNFSVRYSPPLHGVGTLLVTIYRASDGQAESRNQTALFRVLPVNDPPVAQPSSADAFSEEATELRLNGSDVDAGDAVAGARIVGLPAGSLFQFNVSAAADGFRGAPIDNVTGDAGAVTDPELRVVYVSPALPSNGSGIAVVGADSFLFRVSDTAGAESDEAAAFAVRVLNNLAALPTAVETDEDVPVNFTFAYRSRDPSDEVRVEVRSLPASAGSRLVAADGTAVTAAMLPFTVPDNSLSLRYEPGANLFGAPLDTWRFAVVRRSDGWVSSEATAAATARPVNDAPLLRVAGAADGGLGDAAPLEALANAGAAAAFGVEVEDPDPDDTPYRVTVEVTGLEGAFVSVDAAAVAEGAAVFRSNDGFTDQRLVFDALRADANRVLRNVTLLAAAPGRGRVAVTVEDRAEGGVTVSRSLEFEVRETASSASATDSGVGEGAVVTTLFFLLFTPFLCCVLYWVVRARRYHHYRRVRSADTDAERREAEANAERRTVVDFLLPLQGQRKQNVSRDDVERARASPPW